MSKAKKLALTSGYLGWSTLGIPVCIALLFSLGSGCKATTVDDALEINFTELSGSAPRSGPATTALRISPDRYDFGTMVTGAQARTLTVGLQNTSARTLYIPSLSGASHRQFRYLFSDCPTGNPIVVSPGTRCNVVVEFSPQDPGSFEYTYTVLFGLAPNDTPFSYSISLVGTAVGPPTYSARSTVTLSQSTVASGETVTLTLQTKDSDGNNVVAPGLNVFFSSFGGTGGGFSTGEISAADDNGDGTYTATFRGVKAGIPTNILGYINNRLIDTTPPTLTVSEGVISPLNSSLTINSGSSATLASGGTTNLKLILKDYGSNLVTDTTQASNLSFTVHSAASNLSNGLIGSITPVSGQNGSYQATLQGTYAGSANTVRASHSSLGSFTSSASFTVQPQFFGTTINFGSGAGFSNIDPLISFNGTFAQITTFPSSDSTQTDFNSGAALTGVSYDNSGGNQFLKLNTSTNNSELDQSWTPQYTNIVGYWNFNNATNSSITNGTSIPAVIGLPGVAVGAMNYVDGKLNSGINLGGSAIVRVDPTSTLSGAYTVALWAKATSFNSQLFGTRAPSDTSFDIQLNSNGLHGDIGDGTSWITTNASAAFNFNTGQWYHIAYAVSTTGYSIYVNGARVGTGTFSGTPLLYDTNHQIAIGSFASNVTGFPGVMDEVAIWSTRLTDSQVQTLYDRQSAKYSGTFLSRVFDAGSVQTLTGLAWTTTLPFLKELVGGGISETNSVYSGIGISENLMSGNVGLWHLDETTGTSGANNDLSDTSNTGAHGEISGPVSLGVPGILGNAASFNGSTYVAIPDSAPLNPTSAITLAGWIKVLTSNSNYWFLSKNNPGFSAGYGIALSHGSHKVWPHINLDGNIRNPQSNGSVTPGIWNHIAVTYNGNAIKIYINGSLDTTSSFSGSIPASSSELRLGNSPGSPGEFLNGSLDEVGIWNRALSDSEITQLYRRGANRIKFQVRSCATSAACASTNTSGWKGPDNTNQSYFSELNNNNNPYGILTGSVSTPPSVKSGTPSLTFSQFNNSTPPPSALAVAQNQYFQYRAILESDDLAGSPTSPALKTVTLGLPSNAYPATPAPLTTATLNWSDITSLGSLTEVLGSGGCTGEPRYLLSKNNSNWYYSNGTNSTPGTLWVGTSTSGALGGSYAEANPEFVVNRDIPIFIQQLGQGSLYLKVFLKSDGTGPCQLTSLSISGSHASFTAIGSYTTIGWAPAPLRSNASGANWTPFKVQVLDNLGNLMTTDNTRTVTLSLTSGTGTLSSATSLTKTASTGIVTFDDIYYNKAETISIQAQEGSSGPSLTRSSIVITPSTFSLARSLISSPSSTAIGYPVTVTLNVLDAQDNPTSTGITGVTLSSSGSGAGTLGSVSTAGNGVYTATFTPTSPGSITFGAKINNQNVTRTPSPATMTILSPQTFSQTQTLNSSTASGYSSGSGVSYTPSYAQLTPLDFSDNSPALFGAGTMLGVAYDTTSSGNPFLRLDTTTNNSELDASWTPQWSNLELYWKMNGTVGAIGSGEAIVPFIASSASAGKILAPNGTGATYENAKLNQGIRANGTSLHFTTAYTPIPRSTNLSYSIWVNPASNDRGAFVTNGDGSCSDYHLWLGDGSGGNGNIVQLHLSCVSWNAFNSIVRIPSNAWTHLILTRGASVWTLYVNGIAQATSTSNPGGSPPNRFEIGSSGYSGAVDEVALFNTELTPTEVQTIYSRQSAKYSGTFLSRVMDAASSQSWTGLNWTSTLPFLKELIGGANSETASVYSRASAGLMAGNIGLWHFNEASGSSTLVDSSGNGNDATPNANVTRGSAGLFGSGVTVTSGQAGNIPVSNATQLQLNDGTLSAWIKTTDAGGGHRGIIIKQLAYSIFLFDNRFIIYDWGGGGNRDSGIDVADGKWHHLAVTFQSGVSNGTVLYLDGSSVLTTQFTVNSQGSGLTFGAGDFGGGSQHFAGSMDEFGIWNRTLSAAEILQLYRRGANRVKFQVRTCADTSACASTVSTGWKGPDNTNQSYFTELNNNANPYGISTGSVTTASNVLASAPSMVFASFNNSSTPPAALSISNNQYIQYRAILESDDSSTSCSYGSPSACSPELKSVSLTGPPAGYPTINPSITSSVPVSLVTLESLTQILGPDGCTDTPRFLLSLNGTTWYGWSGIWTSVGSGSYAQANTEAEINSHLSTFASDLSLSGNFTLFARAYLHSNGTAPCQLTGIAFSGTHHSPLAPLNTTAQIAWKFPPAMSGLVAGVPMPNFSVLLLDSNGNLNSNGSTVVTLSATTPSALTSTTGASGLSKTAVSGVATFSGIIYTKAENFTLTATDASGHSINRTFIVLSPTTYSFSNSLLGSLSAVTGAAAGVTNVGFPIPVTLTFRDAYGNSTTDSIPSLGSVSFNVQSGPSGSFDSVINRGGGVYSANFTPASLGTSVIGATIGGNAVASTTSITVGGNQLALTSEPSGGTTVKNFALPTLTVEIQDSSHTRITSATNPVTVAIQTNPGSATLSGTTTVNAVAGIATFSNLIINQGGNGYTLRVTSSNFTPIVTATFDILDQAPPDLIPGVTVQYNHLTNYWKLKGSGSISNGDTIVATVGTNASASGSGLSYDTIGQGIKFTGNNNLTLPDNSPGIPTGNSAYTLSAWILATSGYGIVGYGNYGSSGQTNAFRLNGLGQLYNFWWNNEFLVNTPEPLNGAWHHVVALYDGSTRSIYEDGVSLGSQTISGRNSPATNFTIGTTNGGEYFSGSIAQVAIWDVGLSASEVLALYQQQINGFIFPAQSLAVTQQPALQPAPGAVLPTVKVAVNDTNGSRSYTTTPVTASIDPTTLTGPRSGAQLTGTLTVNSVNGIATFSDLHIDTIANGYKLKFSSGSLSPVSTNSFNVIAPFTVTKTGAACDPNTAAPGTCFSLGNPTMWLRGDNIDGALNSTLGAYNSVSTWVDSSGAGYSVTEGDSNRRPLYVPNAANGFGALQFDGINDGMITNLTINNGPVQVFVAYSAYCTLSNPHCPVLKGSGTWIIGPWSNLQAAFYNEPLGFFRNNSDVTGGLFVIQTVLQSASGISHYVNGTLANSDSRMGVSPGTFTLSNQGPHGNTLNGNIGEILIYQVSDPSTLRTQVEAYLSAKYSQTRSQIAFVAQPSAGAAGLTITPDTQVAVLDAGGSADPSYTGNITLSLNQTDFTNGTATLAGTTTVAAVNGVAKFKDLMIDKIGTGYSLTATASGGFSGSVTSNSFDVVVGKTATVGSTTYKLGLPALWLNGDDVDGTGTLNAALTDSATQSLWKDLSGNNRDATQANSGRYPTLVKNAINGHGALQFTGSQGMTTGLNITSSNPISGTFETFVVYEITNNDGPAIQGSIQYWIVGAQGGKYAVLAPGGNWISNTFPVISGGYIVDTLRQSRNGVSHYIGGEFMEKSSLFPTYPSVIGLGAEGGWGQSMNGRIAEVLIYLNHDDPDVLNGSGQITSGGRLRSAIEAYLLDKYTSPVAQLAFTTQPTSGIQGFSISPNPTLELRDAAGLPIITSNASVTLSIDTNVSGTAQLTGTTTVNAFRGKVIFNDLAISDTGNGYTLIASTPGPNSTTITSPPSSVFNVTAGLSTLVGATSYVLGSPALWLNGDNIDGIMNAGLSDGASVSTWVDSSGNNHHATQSDSNRFPTYAANSPTSNGHGSIRLLLRGDSLATDLTVSSYPVQATVVYSTHDTNRHQAFLQGSSGWLFGTWPNFYLLYNGALWGEGPATVQDQYFLFTIYQDSFGILPFVNGSSVPGGTANPGTTPGTFLLGPQGGPWSGNTADGNIAEVFVYTSGFNRAKVETYLKSKYNIP